MSTLTADLISRLRACSPELRDQFGVRQLRLFGSVARDAAGPESDVDLLVDFALPATARRFYGLQVFLEDLLGRSVDLVTERSLRAELRQTVERDAITI